MSIKSIPSLGYLHLYFNSGQYLLNINEITISIDKTFIFRIEGNVMKNSSNLDNVYRAIKAFDYGLCI